MNHKNDLPTRRLADFLPGEFRSPPRKLSEFLGVELVVKGGDTRTGRWGEYAIFTAETPNGEVLRLYTGAKAVVAAIRAAREAGAFPLQAKFVPRGRSIAIE